MATGGRELVNPVRVYNEDDKLDGSLLNQISSWIMFNRLRSLALHLGFNYAEISRIMTPSRTPEEQILEVLQRWKWRHVPTLHVTVESMADWYTRGYLDPRIWEYLAPLLNPNLLPAPSVLQIQPETLYAGTGTLEYGPSFAGDFQSLYIVEEPEADRTTTPSVGDELTAPSVIGFSPHSYLNEIVEMKRLLKESLRRIWSNSLSNCWSKKAHSFPVDKYYVSLKWARMISGPFRNVREEMNSIYDILGVDGPRSASILITAEPGMGKTASVAMLAMKYVNDSEELKAFDFVFTIRLRFVNSDSSLVEIIIQQHDRFAVKKVSTEQVEAILEGKTQSRVLLIMDGYDEYKPGTNTAIDEALLHTIGDCFILLTSRPGYVSKEIRDKMDGELTIEGFSEENISRCSAQYLGSEEMSDNMIEQAKQTGLYDLLHIPIVLLMTCLVFNDKRSLPKTRTEMYHLIFHDLIDLTALKTFPRGLYEDVKEYLDALLDALGELSWKALQSDVQQLLLNTEEIKSKSPFILKLGLLFETDEAVTTAHGPNYVSFPHKSLQEFSASLYIKTRLERSTDVKRTLCKLFPSWEDIRYKNREVVIFLCGLMSDPTPLAEHVYHQFIGETLEKVRAHSISTVSIDHTLVESMYREAAGRLPGHPLHNPYINYYNHWADGRNTSPVNVASRLYAFKSLKKEIFFNIKPGEDALDKPSECACYVYRPNAVATKSVLTLCRHIGQHQEITDLWMEHIKCDDNVPMFNLSPNVVSVILCFCALPFQLIQHLSKQISESTTLQKIHLQVTSLKDVTSLNLSNKTSLTNLHLFATEMSPELTESVCKQLKYLVNLKHVDLSGNHIGVHAKHIAEAIQSWGPDPSLKVLHLSWCQIPADICGPLLSALSNCKHLTHHDLGGNTVTGCLSNFIPSSHAGLPSMKRLWLSDAALCKDDILHVKSLIESFKMPALEWLSLAKNGLNEMQDTGDELIEACVRYHGNRLTLYLENNDLSEEFKDKWKKRCTKSEMWWLVKGTNIELYFN